MTEDVKAATAPRATLGDLAAELRECVTQHAALGVRLQALSAALSAEAGESGAALAGPCPYDEIVAEWNARCAKVGMRTRARAGELKPKILLRWRKHPSLDLWRAAFDACARDAHWRGENGWAGSLESFLRLSHADRFFDEALGSMPKTPAPETTGLFASGARSGESADEFLDRLLDDPSVRLPTGFSGKDPREARGRNDEEFVRRYDALKSFLRADWRFSR